MAFSAIPGLAVRGICSAVPATTHGVKELTELVGGDAEKVVNLTGVRNRHIAREDQTASDLCYAAADRLLKSLEWDRSTVDGLVFVSETFDYFLPASACVLQARLGLPSTCAAFDVGLGCSGYVYGLWIASSLLATGCKRVLLLAGETSTKLVSPQDKASVPLFGDAGTATALEKAGDQTFYFELGTDGTGYKHLYVPAGAFRQRHSPETARRTLREGGNIRSEEDVVMNGAEIFTFTLREVPPLLNRVLGHAGWKKEDVDLLVMHQANRFILTALGKKMGIPLEKVPIGLEEYGNTVSASIPLAMSHCVRQALSEKKQRVVLAGFGVGLSWAAAAMEIGPIVMPEVELVP